MAADPARGIVDLSREIVDGMTTHPGIPPPSISTFLTHGASTARPARHDVRDGAHRSRRAYRDVPRHAGSSIRRRAGLGRLGAGARRRPRRESSSIAAARASAPWARSVSRHWANECLPSSLDYKPWRRFAAPPGAERPVSNAGGCCPMRPPCMLSIPSMMILADEASRDEQVQRR